MKTGTVKFFNIAKGFGFITEDGTGTDIFVHITGLVNQVKEKDKVTFEVEQGRTGPTAINVKKA